MKEHIVIVDEGSSGLDRLTSREFQKIEIDHETVQMLGDSFTAVSQAMSDLAKAIQKDVYKEDYLAMKKIRETSFKDGVSNLKHIKKRGGW